MEWLRRLLGLPPGPAESTRLVEQIKILNSQVQASTDAEDYERALQLQESCIPLLKRLWSFHDVARVHNNAGWLCEQLGRWRQALIYYRKALKDWKRIGEDRGQAIARTGIGRVLIHVDEVDRAREELEIARSLFQKNKDDEGLVHVLQYLVDAYSQLGLDAEERERAQDLLVICRRLPDKTQEAQAAHLLGIAERKMEHYPASLAALKEAEAAYQKLGNDRQRAAVLENLADTYRAQKVYPKALQALEEALGLWVKQGDRDRECYAHNLLGAVQALAGSYVEAENHFRQALELLGGSSEHRQKAEGTIILNLADLYLRQEKYAAAVEYADQADKKFSAISDYPASLMALRLGARAEQKQREAS